MKKFSCMDIGLASYLKSHGGTVELVRENDHFLFEFAEYELCEQLAKKYWNKKAIGNIKDYEEAKQTLISMIKNNN